MNADPFLGLTLGNVRLTERIGQGAMGVVYKGWHERLGRAVAVKMLLDTARGNAKGRFLREARVAAQVNHPNVVRVLDAGDRDGNCYLVMELVDGHSLGHIIDETGPMDPTVVMRLATGLARGLAAIHAAGIIHRDIKPDNLLVGTDGVPKITDLGLAKQLDNPDLLRLTATGVVVGTPLYVSPESIRDPKTITGKADVYSLGASLYHLLSGKPPFDSDSSYEVMRAQLEDRPRPLVELRSDVPAGLAQLVERCLDKNAARRPDADQLATLLAQGAGLRPRLERPLLRLIAVTVAVVLALAVGGLWLFGRSKPPVVANTDLAKLTIQTSLEARVRLDDGPWLTIDRTPLEIPPGLHQMEVEAIQSGPRLSWRGSLALMPNQVITQPVTLAPTPVTGVRVALPNADAGLAMAYVDGGAYGLENVIALPLAGTYALGRWDGTAWQAMTTVVDGSGRVTTSIKPGSDHPGGPAWWCERDATARPVDRHHVVCWWEAERIRLDAGLPASSDWQVQGQRPEQPALAVPTALVTAIATRWNGSGMILPGQAAALRLVTTYRTGLWVRERERLDVVGGASATALLVVVPTERQDN
jgi:tRNA A-37 threonylcarbamoyl transferase component Bud32